MIHARKLEDLVSAPFYSATCDSTSPGFQCYSRWHRLTDEETGPASRATRWTPVGPTDHDKSKERPGRSQKSGLGDGLSKVVGGARGSTCLPSEEGRVGALVALVRPSLKLGTSGVVKHVQGLLDETCIESLLF